MAAIAISNQFDLRQYEAREARYLQVSGKYDHDELITISQILGDLVLEFDAGPDDILGRLFHELELHNKWVGQFFTPFAISRMMGSISVGEEIKATIVESGYFTLSEPATGSGSMVIGMIAALEDQKLDYRTCLHITAVDIDIKCVHMTYLQLAILGVPAVVVHGNSISLEEYSHWYTPAHIIDGWSRKLWMSRQNQSEPTLLTPGSLGSSLAQEWPQCFRNMDRPDPESYSSSLP